LGRGGKNLIHACSQEFPFLIANRTGIMKCYLKERRMERYLTQTQLAELSGISRSQINRIEKGHASKVYVETALILAKYLNCKVEDIFSLDE